MQYFDVSKLDSVKIKFIPSFNIRKICEFLQILKISKMWILELWCRLLQPMFVHMSACLSRSGTVRKPLDRMRCHVAGTP